MKTKHLLLALLACCAFVACEEDNPKLNNDYKVYINGVDREEGNKAVNQERLTAHEICKLDTVVMLYCRKDDFNGASGATYFTLELGNLDTLNNRLVMEAGNINGLEGNFLLSDEWQIYLQANNFNGDTVGYVPAIQRSAIIDELTPLFADGREKNIDKILEIFQTAFEFYPCTGAEYEELKAQNLN